MSKIEFPWAACNSGRSFVYDRLPARLREIEEEYGAQAWTHLHPIIPPMAVDKGRLRELQTYHGWTERQALKAWASRFGGKCPGAMDNRGHWYPIGVHGEGVYDVIETGLRAVFSGSHYEPEPVRLAWDCVRAWTHGAGIGVNGAWWPCIDVDLHDPAEAHAVKTLLWTYMGDSAQRGWRVGNPPRGAIPFDLAPPDEDDPEQRPLRKMTLTVRDGEQIEVLAHGTQWVLAGMHGKTGRPYRWIREDGESGPPPYTGKLPFLSAGELRDLLEAIGRVLGVENARVQVSWAGSRIQVGEGGGGPGGLLEGPEDLGAEVLAPWPNDRGVGRDKWVAVGHALWGASGGSAWGLKAFQDWARGWPDADPADDVRLWQGIKSSTIGVDWLIQNCPGVSAGQQVAWLLKLESWRKARAGEAAR